MSVHLAPPRFNAAVSAMVYDEHASRFDVVDARKTRVKSMRENDERLIRWRHSRH
jgi:hypothetical protein